MADDLTPILVGCGDVTDHVPPENELRSVFDLIAQAGRLALDDAESKSLPAAIDTVVAIRLFSDSTFRFQTALGTSPNPPRSIANRLGLNAARHIYTSSGGNMPQYMVNHLAEAITQGRVRAALIAGGEALRSQHVLERAGHRGIWSEEPGGPDAEPMGDFRRAYSDYEERHNARAAIAMYPLIEHAVRRHRGASVAEHLQSMARLFARFSDVAAENPLAMRRERYSAARLATIDGENRWIGFPYPRLMNANAFIDQAAALVITSVSEARRLAIPEHKWVYLHGCADGTDQWFLSDRAELHRSAAIRLGSRQALAMADKSLADMHHFDLYSCFPSAVEIACQEIGLAEDDPRPLTVTGGLPYFGGPGNNYVTHSIAAMMRTARAAPGTFGLVTANGNYVTKHSFGIYSTEPFPRPWQRQPPEVIQRELDALPSAPLVDQADGRATIETYTVVHGKEGPQYAVILGRLQATGERFIANTPTDAHGLAELQEYESLDRAGIVRSHEGRNLFVPE